MKVLVHYDAQGMTAHGLWWINQEGVPAALYHDMDSPERARGSVLIYSKANPQVSWERWFDELTNRAPYFEAWQTYDSMGFTPEQMLTSLDDTPLAG